MPPRRRRSVKRKPSGQTSSKSQSGRKTTGRAAKTAQALQGAGRPSKNRGPLWTLDQGVTYSSLNTWESCQEQFGLKYIDGLSTKAISIPLEFGNIMHFGLECQLKFPSALEAIYHVTSKYRVWRGKTLLNPRESDTLDFLCGLAEITFPAYCDYWDADDKKLNWIGREEKFDVPYDVQMPDGSIRTIRLRGMRDGLFRPKQSILGLFETKTKSRISENEIRDGLKADMQTLFYIFVTYLERGELPTTIKYNIIRRSDKKPHKNESVDSQLDRIKKDIKARPDFYFMRFNAELVKKDVDEFVRRTLNPLLVRFIHWWDNLKKSPLGNDRFQSPFHSLNLNSLIGKYGRADMYSAIVDRNRRPYRIRTAVFPELEDSFLVTPTTP